ncbi:MFS general substrate transporter [Aspergillus ellipticus CBS 707.79]|uniref:MFS general substrate transporter n=1 Tax=Aspergillus ellipticus CBS 707.79 TaxID=1448320 RepID=A0A319EAE0_9EURO|nr:MFS general substrate transporter [Aspergillus ellipticus CBS 707.79]
MKPEISQILEMQNLSQNTPSRGDSPLSTTPFWRPPFPRSQTSSYLLTTCCLILTFGKIYTFYSTKWIFLAAVFIFKIGSLVCGTAPNSVALIIGRAIAGVGSAGLFSGSLLIIAQTAPLERRPIYTASITFMYGVASVTGPLMGGMFTDHVTWRWCFYINLPVGGLTILFIYLCFTAPKSVKTHSGLKSNLSQFDLPGLFFFLPCIVCILLALQWGGATYTWGNVRIIVLFVLFGVLISIFVVLQILEDEKAMVPPRVIKNRNVWGATLFNFCLGGVYFMFIYYLPIWFQAIKNVSATTSGLMNIPMLLGVVVFSIIAGALVSTLGYYTPFMLVAPVLVGIGGGLLSTLTVDAPTGHWLGYQVIMGMGIGVGLQQPMVVVQAALDPADIPSATAIVMFAQILGGAVFVSVAQNVFQNELFRTLAQVPGVDAQAVVDAGATLLRDVVSPEVLSQVLTAYNMAVTHTFYVGMAIGSLSLLGALPVEWLSVQEEEEEEARDGRSLRGTSTRAGSCLQVWHYVTDPITTTQETQQDR